MFKDQPPPAAKYKPDKHKQPDNDVAALPQAVAKGCLKASRQKLSSLEPFGSSATLRQQRPNSATRRPHSPSTPIPGQVVESAAPGTPCISDRNTGGASPASPTLTGDDHRSPRLLFGQHPTAFEGISGRHGMNGAHIPPVALRAGRDSQQSHQSSIAVVNAEVQDHDVRLKNLERDNKLLREELELMKTTLHCMNRSQYSCCCMQ